MRGYTSDNQTTAAAVTSEKNIQVKGFSISSSRTAFSNLPTFLSMHLRNTVKTQVLMSHQITSQHTKLFTC